jgi:hypothetical protein
MTTVIRRLYETDKENQSLWTGTLRRCMLDEQSPRLRCLAMERGFILRLMNSQNTKQGVCVQILAPL